MFPELLAADAERERKYYADRGMAVPSTKEQTGSSNTERSEEETPNVVQYKDEIQFRLDYDTRSQEPEDGPRLGPLRKPIITTSARVTVMHLKKFIAMDLKFPNVKEIDVLYRDEVLGTEHTVEYILKSRGHRPHDEAVLLFRRRNAAFPSS
eukprot:TRINITY_DN5416_c0_g1_i1.p3 TRINITY_DN5416_c0_g1~~TRINITY_DN5416_c0_g1_i1.p3  ORF type:complete len:152 (+),score=47.51 TRINITY_DN5416_c0_g1_i1:590-1045(+)